MTSILHNLIILVGVIIIVATTIFSKQIFVIRDERLVRFQLFYFTFKWIQCLLIGFYYIYLGMSEIELVQTYNDATLKLFIVPFGVVLLSEWFVKRYFNSNYQKENEGESCD